MKRFSPLAALVVCLASASAHTPALAQQHLPSAQPVVAAPAPEIAHPALWKVADGDTTIYLFGTIHLLPKNIDWLDGPIAAALDSSAELVTELPETAEGEASATVLRYGVLPPGRSLRGLLTPKELTKYRRAMAGLDLPEATFDRFKPWYAAVVMATLPLQKKGFNVAHGVEAELSDRAAALHHSRAGLETMDFQLGLFDKLPVAVQKRYLLDVIDELPKLDGEVAAMIGAWKNGDPARLARLLNASEDDPQMVTELLTNRNRNWARWIEARLARPSSVPGSVFVAVGAGHLGGKGGVPDLLARAGYKVTRVQ